VYDFFLPDPFQFISHPTIQRYVASALKASFTNAQARDGNLSLHAGEAVHYAGLSCFKRNLQGSVTSILHGQFLADLLVTLRSELNFLKFNEIFDLMRSDACSAYKGKR
jgi:hypothetical protein